MNENITALRLRKIRGEKGLAQDVVSTACEISRVALARYENGSRFPKADIIARLAEYYGVTSDYLLGRDSDEETEESLRRAANNILGSNQRYIAEVLPKLNEDQAKAIRAIIDQMDIK